MAVYNPRRISPLRDAALEVVAKRIRPLHDLLEDSSNDALLFRLVKHLLVELN
jgi:hypothetical protein